MNINSTAAFTIILFIFALNLSAQKKLVIIGSSTSACMNVDPVTECYAGRLNTYYNAQTPFDTTIDNHLARGGTNCYNGMPSTYVSPYPNSIYLPTTDINITAALALKPDVILVNYPTNGYDLLSASEVMFCLRTIKTTANNSGVPCYITTTQPRTSAPNFNNSAAKLRLAILKDSILAAFGNYAVDFWTGLINPPDSSILYDSGDQTHMNGAGHKILFQRVLAKNIFGVASPSVPSCITNTSPSNGAAISTATTATLTWPAAANATSYDVYCWSGATAPAALVANTSALSYTVSDLTSATVYYWFIVPKNSAGPALCNLANKTTFTTAAAATNQPTVSNAGNNVTITQPVSPVTLDGSASTGNIVQYYWFQEAGPVSSLIGNNFSKLTTASGLITAGTYVFGLQVKDNLGVLAYSYKTVFVNPAGTVAVPACVSNISPANGAIISTSSTATLIWPTVANATSYDVYCWSGAIAPAVLIANTSAVSYTVSGLTAATIYHWFIVPKNSAGPAPCNVTNNTSFTTAATTGNQPPVSAAGSTVTIVLPTSSLPLNGSASYDPDGSVVQYYWYQTAGPVSSVVGNNFLQATTASGLTSAGTYVFGLQVKDNVGALAYSYKTVIVKAAGTRIADTNALQIVPVTTTVLSPLPILVSTITPNPVTNGQSATLVVKTNRATVALISIIGSNGYIISNKTSNLAAGSNKVSINTSGVSQGWYIVRCRYDDKVVNLKLFVL